MEPVVSEVQAFNGDFMYKCEICGERRGFGKDHSKCSKKLQEMHKDRPRLEYKQPIKPYSSMYGRV